MSVEGDEDMLELYNRIKAADPDCQNLVLTVVKGQAAGEKALVSDHRLVWESAGKGYFTEHKKEIEELRECGLLLIDGQSVFCERLGGEKKLVICGGGHVSIPIIQMGRMLGFEVTVLEDRPMFADHARRAKASRVICEPFEQGLRKVEGDADTFFVVVTRGHRYDQVCLESIVKKRHAYIGMIGSRKRAALVKESVIAAGGSPQVVNSVHSPIGLDIGAETPEEIAVAIMAEIIEVKNRDRRGGGYPKELLEALAGVPDIPRDTDGGSSAGTDTDSGSSAGTDTDGGRVLATIVSRRGSAPRAAGTKMLVLPDGSCVGTIGGGCAEAEVLRKALWLLRSREKEHMLCHIDMTGRDAEEEGMVCGGVIDVFLEIV